MPTGSGILYVVATPIGNLEDLTFRAHRILGQVSVIAAEDTRRTAKLLAHYGIRTATVSVREHNEAREAPKLVQRLIAGDSVALVTDAGTPGIADPGATLVRTVRAAGIAVVAIPGPSAVTAALSLSGLLGPEFAFMGFPPATGTARRTWFERAGREARAIVFFEAPHRISRTLRDVFEYWGERPIHVHRELTKAHESYVKWQKNTSGSSLVPRGEFVLVVEPLAETVLVRDVVAEAGVLFGRLTDCAGFSPDEIERIVSAVFHLGPSQLRKVIKKRSILVKRQTSPSA